ERGRRARGLLAHVRGQRARRPPLLRGSARARLLAHRDHRRRRVVPPGRHRHGLHVLEGRGLPLRRDTQQQARRRPGVRDQPRARAHRDDGGELLRRRAVDAAGASARARAQARDRPLRRAHRALPPRRARRRRRAPVAHRRRARRRPERDPASTLMRTLLCFGDSNTWGYDPESGPRTERYPRDVRWPGRLARALGDEWEVIAEGLNGRTATRDDPIWEGRNGLTYLLPCLRSHAPLDLVVIYLGTNDVAERYSLPAEDVAASVGRLVKVVRTSESGPGESAPDVLVVCPPPFATLDPLYAAAGQQPRHPRKR